MCVLFRTIMSKRKGADAANGKAPGKKTKSKAEACDAGRVRFASPGKGARAAEPMPNFVMLKEKYLLTNAYMDMVENAVAITDPASPSKKPKKRPSPPLASPPLPPTPPPHRATNRLSSAKTPICCILPGSIQTESNSPNPIISTLAPMRARITWLASFGLSR